MKLNTYLNFGGNCEEAFHFYEQHLGGKITGLFKWNQMPDAEKHTPPGFENKVLHGRMALADTVIMGSDVPGNWQPMKSAYLSLAVDNTQDADRIYNALAEGGQVFMKMGETFFAHRFGQLQDKFGVNWMIIHEKSMN